MFQIKFPEVILEDFLKEKSLTRGALMVQLETRLKAELTEPGLRIINVVSGSIIATCAVPTMEHVMRSLVEHKLVSKALDDTARPITFRITLGTATEPLEYDDYETLKIGHENFLRPLLCLPPPQKAIANHCPEPKVSGISTSSRMATAATVELLLDNCLLGKPLRADDEMALEEDFSQVPATDLYWYPKADDPEKKRMAITITDTETRITSPIVPMVTVIANSDPKFMDKLHEYLAPYLHPT
jgi:hypothetical protein